MLLHCPLCRIAVLPISVKIAELSQSAFFTHGDPADRLIAATELTHRAPFITAEKEYRKRNASGAVYDDPRVAVGAGRFDEVGAAAKA